MLLQWRSGSTTATAAVVPPRQSLQVRPATARVPPPAQGVQPKPAPFAAASGASRCALRAGDGARWWPRSGTVCAASKGGAAPGPEQEDAPGSSTNLPPLPSRRSVTSMRQLLQVVRQLPPAQRDHAMLGRVCVTVLRLLAKQERAAVVLRRDARRALVDLSVFRGVPPRHSSTPPLPTPSTSSSTDGTASILMQARPSLSQPHQSSRSTVGGADPARRRRRHTHTAAEQQAAEGSSISVSSWQQDGTPAAMEEACALAVEVLQHALQHASPAWDTCTDAVVLAHLVQAVATVQTLQQQLTPSSPSVPPPPTSSALPGSTPVAEATRAAAAVDAGPSPPVASLPGPLPTATLKAGQLLPRRRLNRALEGMLPQLDGTGGDGTAGGGGGGGEGGERAGVRDDCLGKLLWGLGRLGHRPSDAWLQAAFTLCVDRSEHLGAWTTIRIISGSAAIQDSPPPAPPPPPPRRRTPPAPPPPANATPPLPPAAPPRAAASPGSPHPHHAPPQQQQQQQQAPPAAAVVGVASPPTCPPWLLADLLRRLRPRLSWLTPGEMVELLGALGTLGYRPSPAWLEDWCQHSSSKLPGLTSALTAQLAAAVLSLRLEPPEWWLRKFMRYAEQALEHEQHHFVGALQRAALEGREQQGSAHPHDASPQADAASGRTAPSLQAPQHAPTISTAPAAAADVASASGTGISAAAADLAQRQADLVRAHTLEALSCLARLNVEPTASLLHRALTFLHGEPPPLPRTAARAPYVQGSSKLLDDSPVALAAAAALAATSSAAAAAEAQRAVPSAISETTDALPPAGVPGTAAAGPASAAAVSGDASAAGVEEEGEGRDRQAEKQEEQEKEQAVQHESQKLPPLRPPPPRLSPWQAVQLAYGVAKFREQAPVRPRVHWGKAQLYRLLHDPQAIRSDVWKEQLPGATTSRANTRAARNGKQAAGVGGRSGGQGGAEGVLQREWRLREQQRHLQRVVDVLYACAELRVLPPGWTRDALLGEVLEALVPVGTPGQCATIMVCLAVLKQRPTEAWAARFLAHMSATLASFSAQELANTLTAAAYLGLEPGEELLGRVRQLATSYDLVQLAMLVRKLQGSRVAAQVPWLAALLADAKRHFASMAGQQGQRQRAQW